MTCKHCNLLALASIAVGLSGCSDRGDPSPGVLADIQASHIEANVPPRTDFAAGLKRDLAAYFVGTSGDPVTVEYELLRDGPTQSGVAYPKFYVWVRVRNQNAIVREGAVRLAAIDRERFEVTDFLSREQIDSDPARIHQVFPGPVCERIKEEMRR